VLKRHSTKIVTMLLALSGCVGPLDDFDGVADPPEDEVAASPSAVLGGTLEPDFMHPWGVSISSSGLSCRGVLIDPAWVLTAAHCVGSTPARITYRRTDPDTGVVHTDTRDVAQNGPSRGMFVHPGYEPGGGFDAPRNDIALLHLAAPFPIDRFLQTVALPHFPPIANQVGSIANYSHAATPPPPGYLAVMRAPVRPASSCAESPGVICLQVPDASLCHGDSGSGYVMNVDGRATVAGIASFAQTSANCDHLGLRAGVTNVFEYRDWIYATMDHSAAQVAGRVRLRWAGRASNGTMSLRCTGYLSPDRSVSGPMNVPGAEIGIECGPFAHARVTCDLGDSTGVEISDFTVRTTTVGGGAATLESLAHEASSAVYVAPASLAAVLELRCDVGRIGSPVPVPPVDHAPAH